MARLNEPPMSFDGIESLRRRFIRQNKELAKSNNHRALRIRELEGQLALMLSDNLQLRSRILELEKQAEDNEARRIADHAMAIKAKLEAQIAEFNNLIGGLGEEPPAKRRSPGVRRESRPRLTFSSHRPSPSQRRLRDIAREIEDLGSISEHKSTSRMSLNPAQIQALRAEAESEGSPDLGPPPMSRFIEEEPVKIDSPSRPSPRKDSTPTPSPQVILASPVALRPSDIEAALNESPSPVKRKQPKQQGTPLPEPKSHLNAYGKVGAPLHVKSGAKRKLASRDEAENSVPLRIGAENLPLRVMAGKKDQGASKVQRDAASSLKERRDQPLALSNMRKPLAVKSSNNDVSSPRKLGKPVAKDEQLVAKPTQERPKMKQKRKSVAPKSDRAATTSTEHGKPTTSTVVVKASEPVADPGLLSPSSPQPASTTDHHGDTPPPADISSTGETTRPSRRNRTSVSYAEPNLRDKMRRPTKELFDAVAGEGKYQRRTSQCDANAPDSLKAKRESHGSDSWKKLPTLDSTTRTSESVPASPLAEKSGPKPDLPESVTMERRRRPSTTAAMMAEWTLDSSPETARHSTIEDDGNFDTTSSPEVDPYEFTTSSPQVEKTGRRRQSSRPAKPSRRFSAAMEEDGSASKDKTSSRRRSMMV